MNGERSFLNLSRRRFLGGVAGAGALPFLPSAAAADTPKHGGRFRLGLAGGSTSDTLEPGAIWDTVMQNVSFQVRTTLVDLAPDGQALPELAESWEPSADARVWVFNLRQGVEFHNGKTFEAEDVVFSINHHRGDDSISGAKGVAASIEDVRADGPSRVIFTLSGPNAAFPYTLSDYHLVIAPAGTTNWDDGIGTGPYVLQSLEPGVRAFATKFANYWRTDRGFFDEVETLTINDTNARTNALIAGQVDAINRLDFRTIGLLERSPNAAIQNIAGGRHYTLPMLTDTPPFTDNDVRLALKWAINRQELVDTVLQGYGRVGNDHPISVVNTYHNGEMPQREYDPDKALFHLRKAGMEGHTFQLHVSEAAFNGAIDAAVLYQENAAQAGIDIELIREPSDGYFSRVWMNAPWCQSYWSGRPTEDAILTLAYSRGANSNDSHWDHERFNTLLVEARGELDDARRREMYYEMQQIVSDEGGVIVPAFLNYVQAATNSIATGEIAGNGEMDGNRCSERWWFA